MVGRLARATIAAGHRPQIQPPNDLHYEPSQVALRQPLVHRRWQQKAGLAVNRAEVAHASDVRASQVLRCHLFYRTIPRRVKSDRLLGKTMKRRSALAKIRSVAPLCPACSAAFDRWPSWVCACVSGTNLSGVLEAHG